MVEFFRGMDPVDICVCLLALAITICALVDMVRVLINMKRGK